MLLNAYEEIDTLNPPEWDIFASQPWSPTQRRIIRRMTQEGRLDQTVKIFQHYAKERIQAAQMLHGDGISKEALQKLAAVFEHFFDEQYQAELIQAQNVLINTLKEAEPALYANELDYSAYERGKAEAQDAYHQAFKQFYRHQIKQLKQINLLLAQLLDPFADPKGVMQAIDQKVMMLRSLASRPIQENHYRVSDLEVISSHIPEGWLTQTQQQWFEKVYGEKPHANQPYSLASKIHDNKQVGQINAVRSEIQIDGELVFQGHRHGSLCPYLILDEIHRQYCTLENAKQSITLAAREQFIKLKEELNSLNNKKSEQLTPIDKTRKQQLHKFLQGESPLPVKISAMSLFGPRKKIKAQKKSSLHNRTVYRQLSDIHFAYRSLQVRTMIVADFIDDNQQSFSLPVEVNITWINFGLNEFSSIKTFGLNRLIRRINNRGINQLIEDFLAQSYLTADLQINEIVAILREIEKQPAIEYAKAKIKQFNKNQLHQHYQELENLTQQIVENNLPAEKIQLLSRTRRKILAAILHQENKLDRLFAKLAHARAKIYPQKNSMLYKKLEATQEKLKNLNKLKACLHFKALRLFIDMLAIYHRPNLPKIKQFFKKTYLIQTKQALIKKLALKTDRKAREQLVKKINEYQTSSELVTKNNFDLQVRFVLLAYHSQHFVEWFCQSGQDRSSLLNEQIEAYCIFMERFGYAPRWNHAGDVMKVHEILPGVHANAPNPDTQAYNNSSPGIKIYDDKLYSPTIDYTCDEMMASLAKKAQHFGKSANKQLQKALLRFEKFSQDSTDYSNNIHLDITNQQRETFSTVVSTNVASSFQDGETHYTHKEVSGENSAKA